VNLAYLELADYLLIAEAVLGIPAERLAQSDPLIALAEVALDAPTEAFEGVEFYPELPQKAAILCSRLVHSHPLSDGNKRTAFMCLIELAERNGYAWRKSGDEAEEDDIVAAMVLLSEGELPETEFIDWVSERLVPPTEEEWWTVHGARAPGGR
jgi:death on curing protein